MIKMRPQFSHIILDPMLDLITRSLLLNVKNRFQMTPLWLDFSEDFSCNVATALSLDFFSNMSLPIICNRWLVFSTSFPAIIDEAWAEYYISLIDFPANFDILVCKLSGSYDLGRNRTSYLVEALIAQSLAW